MSRITLGNDSVIEEVKKDPGLDASPDNVYYKARKDLGKRVTTMSLNETDIDDKPSRAMNLAMLGLIWPKHSDKPPAWVEGDDRLLVELVADQYACPIGRPKKWKEG